MPIEFQTYRSPSGEYRNFIARGVKDWEASAATFDHNMITLQINDNYLWSKEEFRKLIEHMQQLLED